MPIRYMSAGTIKTRPKPKTDLTHLTFDPIRRVYLLPGGLEATIGDPIG